MFNVLSLLIQSLLHDDDLYKMAIVIIIIIQYEYCIPAPTDRPDQLADLILSTRLIIRITVFFSDR